MTHPAERWSEVGRLLSARVKALVWAQADLVRESGVSAPIVRNLMRGDPGRRNDKTLGLVSLAVGWTADSIDRILEGGEPELLYDISGRIAQLEGEMATTDARLQDVEQRLRALREALRSRPDAP